MPSGPGALDTLARRFDLPALAGKPWSEDQFRVVRLALDCLTTSSPSMRTWIPLRRAQLFEALERPTLGRRSNDELARELALGINALFGALGLTLLSSAGQWMRRASFW